MSADLDERPRPRLLGRLGALVVVASFVGIWGYVMWLSVVDGRPVPRDRLDEAALTEELESVCVPYREQLDGLPFAGSARTPAARADLLDEATTILDAMVDDLADHRAAVDPKEATAVDAWVTDWAQYNVDRRAYAVRFREGEDRPFRVTDRGGFHIDILIDDFAKVNFMESCMTPTDV